MRLRFAVAALAVPLGVACAHVEAPSGGPEDKTPPSLLVTRPESLAVVPRWDAPAVLVFDERISERGVLDAVMVSPRTSMVVVDHSGDELRVRLREGWRPGTIYHVSVLPGIQDLFSNRLPEPVTLVFSTGPEIPETVVQGVVTDPITGKAEVGIRVEAIRSADSLVYAIPTDSAGGYRIARVPEGEYRLRAYRDLNRNRALDPFEPRGLADVTLAVRDTVRQALGVLMPDSTPPQVASVTLRDSLTVEVKTDDYLDPTQELPPAAVQIRDPQGTFVTVSRVAVGQLPDDSPTQPQPAPQRRGAPRAGARGAAADTAARPLPSQTLVIRLEADARIQPGTTYTIRIRNLRNLVGLSADVSTELKAPEREERRTPAPTDTVPRDTARGGVSELRRPGTPEP